MEKLYSPKEAGVLLGVKTQTIRQMDINGRIKCIKTSGGKRRIPENEIRRLIGISTLKKAIIYARVSSYDQKKNGDLQRQINTLQENYKNIFQSIEIISDIGSGLNENRKGLKSLLNLIINRQITDILITHEDRLTRFGFKYLKLFFESYDVTIHVLNENINKSVEKELTDDLITIISSFSGRLYGLRSHQSNRLKKVVKETLEDL